MELNWATPLYLLGLYGLTRFFVGKNSEDGKLPWTPLESVAVTMAIYFVGYLLGGLIIYSVLYAFGWSEFRVTQWAEENAFGRFVMILSVQAIMIGMLAYFLKKRQSGWKAIGLYGRPKLSDAGHAIVTYFAYMICYLLLYRLVEAFVPGVDLEQKQQLGFDAVSSLQLPMVFVSLVILPPIVEEILVRGFVYTGLKSKLPKIAAVLITSTLFAIAHLQAGSSAPLLWVAAMDTFLLSVFLIRLRDKTGKLWSPMMLHGLKNLVAFLAIFVFKVAN